MLRNSWKYSNKVSFKFLKLGWSTGICPYPLQYILGFCWMKFPSATTIQSKSKQQSNFRYLFQPPYFSYLQKFNASTQKQLCSRARNRMDSASQFSNHASSRLDGVGSVTRLASHQHFTAQRLMVWDKNSQSENNWCILRKQNFLIRVAVKLRELSSEENITLQFQD